MVRTEALRRPGLGPSRVKKIAERMLSELGLEDTELSVLLTGDAAIQELNRRFRKKDKPTDVLAFPMDEARSGPGPRLLGDVVISLETAGRQARKAGHSLLREVIQLLAHGLLHLTGYDHANRAQTEVMEGMTARLVAAIGPPGPRVTRERLVRAGRAKGGAAKP